MTSTRDPVSPGVTVKVIDIFRLSSRIACATTTPDIMTTKKLHLEQILLHVVVQQGNMASASTVDNMPTDAIQIESIQHKDQIFILPDISEKKASKNPKAKWRDGKYVDHEYPLMDDDERRKLVLSEQQAYSNSPNYRGVAKGKTYSDRPFRGKIVHPIPGAENSGINSDNILILDSGDANFDIQVRSMLDGKQVGTSATRIIPVSTLFHNISTYP